MHRYEKGFTLIEISLIIAIIGIIMGGIFMGSGAFFDTGKYKDDQRRLLDIKSALLSHVATKGYLPCPDTDGDGEENATDNYCSSEQGFLPHATLNTHSHNAYGYRFYYAINTQADTTDTETVTLSASYFGRGNCNTTETAHAAAPPCFSLKTPPNASGLGAGGLSICDETQAACNAGSNYIAQALPLVVVSFGKNSVETWGSNNTNGVPACPATLSALEQTNCSHSETTPYFHRAPQNREGTQRFDDVLIWLTSQEVKQKLPSVLVASDFKLGSNNEDDPQILPPTIDDVFPTEPTQEQLDTQFTQLDGTSATDVSQINGGKKGNTTDQVYITGDVTQTINLYQGTDTVYIAGDLDARLNADQHTKTIFIKGSVTTNGYINIDGNQGNYIEIGENNAGRIDVQGNGTNQVIIYGDILDYAQSYITMTRGTNHLYIGGNVLGDSGIKATVTGTIYLGKTSAQFGSDLTRTLNRLSATTILCRETIGSNNFVSCI